jgi:hypothetical protein
MTEHLSKEIGMAAETASSFEMIDDQKEESWHSIGELVRTQLAALAPQMTVAAQGGVLPDQWQSASVRRAA